jgi:hypothetical protein
MGWEVCEKITQQRREGEIDERRGRPEKLSVVCAVLVFTWSQIWSTDVDCGGDNAPSDTWHVVARLGDKGGCGSLLISLLSRNIKRVRLGTRRVARLIDIRIGTHNNIPKNTTTVNNLQFHLLFIPCLRFAVWLSAQC